MSQREIIRTCRENKSKLEKKYTMSIFIICCHHHIGYSAIRGYECGKILVLNFKERDYFVGRGVDGIIILILLLDNPDPAEGQSASKQLCIVKSFKVKNK
jgi:hypothetical protein